MAKVLLINPNKWGRGITAIWIPSHAAALKAAGHEVQLFDCTFYKNWTVDEVSFNTSNQQYQPTAYHSLVTYNSNDVHTDLQKKLDDYQPDIIFWSAISSHIHGEGEYVNVQYGYELISELKTNALKATAGLQITADLEKSFLRFPKVDVFISGESELVLTELVSNLTDKSKYSSIKGLIYKNEINQIVVNPRQDIIANLDHIPLYDYSLFDPQVFWRPYNGKVLKAVDYEMSRGCIFTCSYCVETVIQKYYGITEKSLTSGALAQPKKYLRSKSAKRIYEELFDLNKNFGVTLVRCQDTNFLTINRQVLNELADLLEKSPIQVKLYIETRVDRMSAADVNLLKRLNVDGVGTGIELSNEEFRKDSLNRFVSSEKLVENFRLLKEAGIKRTTYNIIGLPKETESMILETIEFNRSLAPDNITVAFYSPYIGTEQAAIGKEENYFNDYEYHVDGQIRSVSKSTLVEASLLNFYKKYFNHFVKNGLTDLNELKLKEGLLK